MLKSPPRESAQVPSVAEVAYLTALKAIREWDMLNPPQTDRVADLGWLKGLVDTAILAGEVSRPTSEASSPCTACQGRGVQYERLQRNGEWGDHPVPCSCQGPCDPPKACRTHGRCWSHSYWEPGQRTNEASTKEIESATCEPKSESSSSPTPTRTAPLSPNESHKRSSFIAPPVGLESTSESSPSSTSARQFTLGSGDETTVSSSHPTAEGTARKPNSEIATRMLLQIGAFPLLPPPTSQASARLANEAEPAAGARQLRLDGWNRAMANVEPTLTKLRAVAEAAKDAHASYYMSDGASILPAANEAMRGLAAALASLPESEGES